MPARIKLLKFCFLEEINARIFATKANPKAFSKISVDFNEPTSEWVVTLTEKQKI